MSKLDELAKSIRSLAPDALAKFRSWFIELDHWLWDRQIEADLQGGKLDRLLDEARADYQQGNSRPL